MRQFRATPESLALLKEIYGKAGGDEAVARELQRLHRERPDDQGVLFALAEVLNGLGRTEQAKALLVEAARESNYQIDLVKRLYKLYDDAGDVRSAAQLLIEAMASRPDQTRDLAALWLDLRRPWRKTRITIALVQELEVPAQAQASKMFWLSELARAWNRDGLAEKALADSVKEVPPFAPAFRSMLSRYWVRSDWDESKKRNESEALISSVERHGASPLAAELRGLMWLNLKDPAKAAAEFAKAQQLGGDSVDLRLAYAVALQNSGQEDRAEKALLKLVEDVPNCEDAYLQLFHRALKGGDPQQAVRILQTWLTADPANVNARVLQATVMLRAEKADTAERIYADLLQREPNNPEVLAGATAFYGDTGRMEEFLTKLEAHRAAHPEDRTVIEQLVLLYATRNKKADAIRVLDETRTQMTKEPDLLYYLSGLYQRVGEKETSEAVLEQVIDIDPQHAAACNDLGYTWAEQNKNLLRAESLVRTAVQKEPDNQSYLDSLGWVYYKRGRFEQAAASLETAIVASPLPDPIILDHLGDAMYRLDRKDEAATLWKRSQKRLGRAGGDEERDEIRQLRLQLQQKIEQSDAGRPVNVAPTADEPAKQAKTQ